MYLDLTISAGIKEYEENLPVGTELFRHGSNFTLIYSIFHNMACNEDYESFFLCLCDANLTKEAILFDNMRVSLTSITEMLYPIGKLYCFNL